MAGYSLTSYGSYISLPPSARAIGVIIVRQTLAHIIYLLSDGKEYLSPHWTAVPCCPLRGQVLVWFTWENLRSGRHFGRQMCSVDPD